MTGKRIWTLVALVPLLTIGVVVLESGLEGVLIPAYEATVDTGGVELDLTAVEEIERRGVDVCPATGPAVIPADLAGRAAAECEPVDGHGGWGYVIGMSVIAAAGAGAARRFGNRAASLLPIAVAVDAAGALAHAYAARAWVDGWWGVVPAGLIAAVLPIILLVVVVPTLLLLIPTGSLRTPRWRVVIGLAAVVAAGLALGAVTYPFVIGSAVNPLAGPWSWATADHLMGLGWTAWMGVVLLAASSLPWRIYDGARWLGNRKLHAATPDHADPSPPVASWGGSGR